MASASNLALVDELSSGTARSLQGVPRETAGARAPNHPNLNFCYHRIEISSVHVKLLRNSIVPVLLTAALLLSGAPGISKVLCISPTGHEAVEELGALCCSPTAGTPALSEPGPCEGCTDYPLAPAAEIKSAQPSASGALHLDTVADLVTSATYHELTRIARSYTPWPDSDSFASPARSTPLRC